MSKLIDEQVRMGSTLCADSAGARLARHRQGLMVVLALIAVIATVALGEAYADEPASPLAEPADRVPSTPIADLSSSAIGSHPSSYTSSIGNDTPREPRGTADVPELPGSTAGSTGSSSADASAQAASEISVVVDAEVQRSVEDGQDRAAAAVRVHAEVGGEAYDSGTFANLYCDHDWVSEATCDAVEDAGPVQVRAELGAGLDPDS